MLVSLRWAAYRGGLAAVRDALQAPISIGSSHGFESAPPPPPAGHPDLVLARAVTDKAITADEAALIGSTRLEHLRLADAAAHGHTYHATNAARHRAERRLLTYLTAPTHPPPPQPAPRPLPHPAPPLMPPGAQRGTHPNRVRRSVDEHATRPASSHPP
ncbi:hypothetical protein ACQPWY_14155 [Pseudonocardia xinjiangensis]|uniref:hypothetical protein n=1 Tax=Pseudonocardia xinjiangensis TaxID=75289 RepID=UPI003D8B7367